MQDKLESVEGHHFDEGVIFANLEEDSIAATANIHVAGIQIVHFDDFNEPVRTVTVPLSAYL